MKCFSLLLMLLVAFCIGLSAQTSQIATLMHEGQMSIFYGDAALKEAHEAAAAGNVITLSAGTFNAVDITKPLTIRGAGMGLTEFDNFKELTVISGEFTVDYEDDGINKLHLEGLLLNKRINSLHRRNDFRH